MYTGAVGGVALGESGAYYLTHTHTRTPPATATAMDAPVDRGVLEMLDNVQLTSPVRERLIGMHKKASPRPPPMRFSAQRALRAFQGSPVRRRKHSRFAPEAYAALLRTPVPVARIKCLRVAIATESPAWIDKFLASGAAEALISRISSLCELRWREENDECMLHEHIRCVLALATSAQGRRALAESAPAPFKQLAELLFRGTRPAALSTRRYIVECLILLTTLDVRAVSVDAMVCELVQQVPAHALSQARALSVPRGPQLALALLHTVDSDTDTVYFLQCTRPRVLRAFVGELMQVCTEFFWIFCHHSNAVWDADGDACASARAPRAPDGITASVEFDAMSYITAHLRLLNALAGALGHTQALSDDLVASGIVPVLDTLRRASQAYYSGLHIELAHLARWLAPRDGSPGAGRAHTRTAAPAAAPGATIRRVS